MRELPYHRITFPSLATKNIIMNIHSYIMYIMHKSLGEAKRNLAGGYLCPIFIRTETRSH